MKIRPDDPKKTKTDVPSEDMLDWAGKLYQRFNRMVSLNEGDPIWVLTIKVLGRILGILVLLALSPFFILGLILAFIGAS